MDPKAIFRKIPIPETKTLEASLFVCHMYESNFSMNGNFIVRIEGNEIARKGWSGPKREAGVFLQEHILDFEVPQIYKGRNVDVRAELRCDTGDWKRGWNFEGFTLVFNSTDKFKQRVFFRHEGEQNKAEVSV